VTGLKLSSISVCYQYPIYKQVFTYLAYTDRAGEALQKS